MMRRVITRKTNRTILKASDLIEVAAAIEGFEEPIGSIVTSIEIKRVEPSKDEYWNYFYEIWITTKEIDWR